MVNISHRFNTESQKATHTNDNLQSVSAYSRQVIASMIRKKVADQQSSQLTQGVIATLQLRNRDVAVATAMLPLQTPSLN